MHTYNQRVPQKMISSENYLQCCLFFPRLTEFEATPSGKLTIEEFHNIDLEEEQDPPCFTEGRKKEREKKEKIAQLEELGEYSTEISSIQLEIERALEEKRRRSGKSDTGE